MSYIGKEIAGYKIRREVGSGGMGVVFRAEHPVLADRPPVAIKVLYTHLVKDIEIKKRFRREAKLLEELQHESIVELKEYLEQDGECYIVMEFFKGKPLSEMIGKVIGPIVHDRSIPIMNQILEGIGYAHENNIIHRDVKPSNILIDRSDKIKITDLGIAKNVGDTSLTATGTKIGTMWYMSPEQVQGKEADITSDIYSLGATFYEMVSGHVPFEYENEFDIMNAHVNETPKSPKEHYAHIPDHIEHAILKALGKKPGDRFQSCERFIDALDESKIEISGEYELTESAFAQPVKQKNKKDTAMISMVAFIILIGFFIFLASSDNSDSYTPSPTTPTTRTPTTRTPATRTPATRTPATIEDLYGEGMEYYDNDEYSMAIPKFREVIKQKNHHYDARLYLGWSYYYTDKYLLAITQASIIVANNPTEDDVEGYYLRAMSNYVEDDYEKAMSDIEEVIRLSPEVAHGYFVRGVMLFELAESSDDYNSSYSSLKNAIKRDPDHANAHGWLGYVSEERGNITNACNHWKKAVELGETDFQDSLTEYDCR